MRYLYTSIYAAMWLGYFGYWAALSSDQKHAEQQEASASRFVRLVALLVAIALLALPSVPVPGLDTPFLPSEMWVFWLGSAVTAAGLLFSIWGRRHLGSNWSQAVTLKEDHELITSGPYAWVRHPIYAGLLLALAGAAIVRGEWRGILAVLLVFVILWRKLKLEEQWMRARFGSSYEKYSRRVAMLIPYVF